MKSRKLPFAILLTFAAILIVSCGNDDKDHRLSNEDVVYLKQKRLQEMYGNGSTTTTSTEIRYVTITNTTNVTAAQ